MSTPATLAITIVFFLLLWRASRYLREQRKIRAWLKRDIAMTQAFHNYIAAGNVEEAREIRQNMRREFEQSFN